MSRSTVLAAACGIAAALFVGVGGFSVGAALVAAGAMFVILRFGLAVIGGLAEPIPDPPDPGELRKVKLTYRCGLCGAEVRMTAAASEDPEPPRHCMEDMDLTTEVE